MEEIKCKSCGAPIIFISTLKNEKMPCDAEAVHFVADITSRDSYITTSGIPVRGKIAEPGTEHAVVGYIPHWATCNDPDKFRNQQQQTPRPPNAAESAPPPAKPKPSLFDRLRTIMKERRPIIFPDTRSHEDIEYAYISGIIIRYNDDTGKFEITVELFDRGGNSVTVTTPDKIKLKE